MKKTSVQDYQLKGNPVIKNIPVVGNLVYDELGQEVLAQMNEEFKGVRNIEDTTDYKKNQPITFSNVPRVLMINQILREITNMHVLSPYEVVQYWDAIPEMENTYADTDSIVVYPGSGQNEDLKQKVLGIIKTELKKTRAPLIVSGLGVERADNCYGFTFKETDYMQIREALFLQRDGKVRYDTSEGLVSSKDGIGIYVPSSQNGLRWLYRYRSGGLYASYDDLLYSDGAGRVQVVQDPQGRAENLDILISSLTRQRDKSIAIINSRYEQATKLLKTGEI